MRYNIVGSIEERLRGSGKIIPRNWSQMRWEDLHQSQRRMVVTSRSGDCCWTIRQTLNWYCRMKAKWVASDFLLTILRSWYSCCWKEAEFSSEKNWRNSMSGLEISSWDLTFGAYLRVALSERWEKFFFGKEQDCMYWRCVPSGFGLRTGSEWGGVYGDRIPRVRYWKGVLWVLWVTCFFSRHRGRNLPFPAELRVLGDTYKGKFTKLAGLQVRKIVCRSQEITPERTIYIAMWSLGGSRKAFWFSWKKKNLLKKNSVSQYRWGFYFFPPFPPTTSIDFLLTPQKLIGKTTSWNVMLTIQSFPFPTNSSADKISPPVPHLWIRIRCLNQSLCRRDWIASTVFAIYIGLIQA